MKRDKRLYPLSWEHHELLLYADQIKMTLTAEHPSYRQSLNELIEKSKIFWNLIFFNHIQVEKEALFSPLIKYTDFQEEIKVLNRGFDECTYLYTEITKDLIQDDDLKNKLVRFSELVIHHVRFEERELFNKIQVHLNKAEFDLISTQLKVRLPRVCKSTQK